MVKKVVGTPAKTKLKESNRLANLIAEFLYYSSPAKQLVL